MTDEEAIRQLISRYAHSADAGEIESLADLFAPEGAIQHYGVRIEPRAQRRKRILTLQIQIQPLTPSRQERVAAHLLAAFDALQ